jgi:hypothetical protein
VPDVPHCAAVFISVAAIMPEGMDSGKQNTAQQSCDRLAISAFSAKRNGQPKGAGTCYNVAMTKQRKPGAKGTKVGDSVVSRARFGKISAVEGIELTEAMEKRASEAGQKGLTAEEYRRTIMRSYRKG